MDRIQLYADDLLQALGPTDEASTPAAAITTITSCTGRLYDDSKDTKAANRFEVLTADAAAAATTIEVATSARFVAGDTVETELDDGTLHSDIVASVTATTIELTTGLATAASAGRKINRRFHPIGATTIEVRSGLRYQLGDAVELRQDDGSRHETTITNRAATFIIIGDALTVAMTAGRRVARKLGADIAMTIFNGAGAAANTKDWGYQGEIAVAHAGLEDGMTVRAEITLVDDDGGATVMLSQSHRSIVAGDG